MPRAPVQDSSDVQNLYGCWQYIVSAATCWMQGVLGLGVGKAAELGDSVKKAYAQVRLTRKHNHIQHSFPALLSAALCSEQ